MRSVLLERAAIFAMSVLIAGCSNLGGDRLPVQLAGESYPHASGPIEAVLTLADNGCWFIEREGQRSLVVFPMGYTKPASDGSLMVGPEDVVLRGGTRIEARGGVMRADLLSGGTDGYWGGYLTFCSPEADEVIVLDTLIVVGRLDG